MKHITLFVFIMCATANAGMLIPGWVDAKSSAVLMIKSVKHENGKIIIEAVPIEVFSGSVSNEAFKAEVSPSSGRIHAGTEIWSYEKVEQGELYFVFSSEETIVNWVGESNLSKVRINEKKKRDISLIFSLDKDKKPIEIAHDIKNYIETNKEVSSYLWAYFEYLVDNNPGVLEIISPAFSEVDADYEDVIQVGEIISNAGIRGRLTDAERGLGVFILCKYLGQSQSSKKLESDDVRWIEKFPGKAILEAENMEDIDQLRPQMSLKSNLMPDGAYAKLMKLLN